MYQRKATEDKELILKYIQEILANIKENSLEMKKEYLLNNMKHDLELPNIICKNWPLMVLNSYNSISKENSSPNFTNVAWYDPSNLEDFYWYLLLKASDNFWKNNGRYPGQTNDHTKVRI